ncbi:MAG: FtsK/SpoIIIE domain-containing protein [Ilumatobacteraceae bacterium]
MPSSDLPDLCVVLHRPGQRPVRRVVAGIGRHDSVASLLGLIDIPARRTGTIPANGAVLVDGRSVDGSGSIEAAGIRQGSSIRVGSSSRRPARATSPWLIVAGPDTGRLLPGDPGRYVVGTAPAAGWRIRDAAIAPHHAIVDVGESGLRSESLRIGAPLDVQRGLGTARHREQHGRSVAGVRTRTPTRPDPGRWTARLVRRPVTAATPESAIEVPDLAPLAPSGSSATGVTSSLSMLVTGLVIAAVLRRPEILLFSLAGGVIAAGAAAVAAVRRRRAARRHRARTAQATARFDRAVDAAAEAAARRLRRAPRFAVGPDGTVVLDDPWALRRWHPTAWAVVVGRGDLVWAPPLTGPPENAARLRERATRTLSAVDLRIELAPGSVVHVSGPDGSVRATVRSLVVQLLIGLGPADLAVAVVTERPDRWQWLDWPERRVAPDRAMVASPDDFEPSHVAPTDEHDERVLLLVLDDASELGTRTSAARRLLDSERPVVVIACAAPDHAAPAVTTVSVRIGEHGRAEVLDHLGRSNPTGAERPPTGIERSDLPLHVTAAGVGEDVAEAVAARLAGWSDPEHLVPGADVPTAVSLAELCGLTSCTPGEELADELVRRWNRLGGDPRPVVALGRAADGLIELDLDRDGPHMLVAGTTGAGKSELLRSLVAGLSLASPPELTSFVLVDYKGGSAFDVCAELPHVVGVVTDLDDRLAARMLVGLDAELRRRERMLRTSGATDLRHHRNLTGSEAIARLVVVIDEFAALASELPEFLGALVGVAQRGRSLGVHLVLATQRPSGVVDEDIRANTNLRLALRVQDAADSLDVLGDRRAVSLPRSIPGRAVVRFGAEELVEFQTARCTGVGCDPREPGLGWSTRRRRRRRARPRPQTQAGQGPDPLRPRRTRSAGAPSWKCSSKRSGPQRCAAATAAAPALVRPTPGVLRTGGSDRARADRSRRSPTPGTVALVPIGRASPRGRETRRWVEHRARQRGRSNGSVLGARCAARPRARRRSGSRSARPSTTSPVSHVAGFQRGIEPDALGRWLTYLERFLAVPSPITMLAVIDEADSFAAALATVERAADHERFERLLVDGPASGLSILMSSPPPVVAPDLVGDALRHPMGRPARRSARRHVLGIPARHASGRVSHRDSSWSGWAPMASRWKPRSPWRSMPTPGRESRTAPPVSPAPSRCAAFPRRSAGPTCARWRVLRDGWTEPGSSPSGSIRPAVPPPNSSSARENTRSWPARPAPAGPICSISSGSPCPPRTSLRPCSVSTGAGPAPVR